jgi:starch synthase
MLWSSSFAEGAAPMKALFAVSECAPFVKTGGLADVAGALPKALAAHGVRTRVLLPAYASLEPLLARATPIGEVWGIDRAARLFAIAEAGVDLILVDAPELFRRPGGPYINEAGVDWPDNHLRFAAFSRVAANLARDGAPGEDGPWRPDVLHVHDWQTALAPAYLRLDGRGGPPCVITIHNMAFQGVFPSTEIDAMALPRSGFHPDGYEYWGQVGFLKAGLVYAERITTVSPTYARELAVAEFGMGLQGVIAARRGQLEGVLNGVDLDVWNPESDPHIPARYSTRNLRGKAANRTALAAAFALNPGADAPLFGLVSRLTRQKGIDLLLQCLPRMLSRGATLAVLGAGDSDLEAAFRAAATAYPGRVGVRVGYHEPLAHLLQAGADSILVPSRFEPCGLTQLYALRYGSPPIVGRTGGLADTVIDVNDAAIKAGAGTGFQFAPIAAGLFGDAIDRACDAFADRALWTQIMRRAMRHPVGWETSAARYAAIYAELCGRAPAPIPPADAETLAK